MTDKQTLHEKRHFSRHEVRCEGRLEHLDESKHDRRAIDVQLWDVGLNGVRLRCPIRLKTNSTWRLRLARDGHLLATLPLAIRFITETGTGDYYIGGQYLIEPALLTQLGVPSRLIRIEEETASDTQAIGDFEAPEALHFE